MTVTVATLAPDAYPGAAIIGNGDPYKLYGYEAMKLILDGLNAAGADQARRCSAGCAPASRTARACSAPTASTPTATPRCAPTASTASRKKQLVVRRERSPAALSSAIAVERERARDVALGEDVAPVAGGQRQLDRARRAAARPRTPRRRARTRRRPGRPRPARRTPANASGRRGAQRERAQDQLAASAAGRRARARRSSQSTGAAVVGVDQRQAEQLVALVDVGDARDGQLQQQLAERGAVARLGDARAGRARSRAGSRGGSAARAAKRWTAASCASSGSTQVVCCLASRIAFSR